VTICIAVSVGEGLVLAADSAVTLEGDTQTPAGVQRQILNSFSFGNKVTQLKDYPIGIMTWGTGSLEDRSILSLILEFEFGYQPAGANN
jgi:hypothetical protein